MSSPIPYSESVEAVPSDEEEDIRRIIDVLRGSMKQHLEQTGQYRRDVHVKTHSCAKAEFRVAADLPPELAQGLFGRPAVYSAVVRFSNSAPWVQRDAVPDGRGLAIQVEDVPGERVPLASTSTATQDFVMVNQSTFIVRNVKDYLRLEEARLEARDQPLRLGAALAAKAWKTSTRPWRGALAAARVASQPPGHPASYTYFSMVPIRYGQYVAKYRVRPSNAVPESSLRSAAKALLHRDAMRRLLIASLARQALEFEVQVQLRTSDASMPIEDATVQWPERESPYRTVAHLILPRQDLSRPEDAERFDGRSFHVWNALLEHRPLGGINRVRRSVYPVSAAWRNRQHDQRDSENES